MKTWAWPQNTGRIGICLFICSFIPPCSRHLESTSFMGGIAWIDGNRYKERFCKDTKAEIILCVPRYCGDWCDLTRECKLVANEPYSGFLKVKPVWKIWNWCVPEDGDWDCITVSARVFILPYSHCSGSGPHATRMEFQPNLLMVPLPLISGSVNSSLTSHARTIFLRHSFNSIPSLLTSLKWFFPLPVR